MKRLVIAAMVLALVGAFAFADGPTLTWSGHVWSGLGIATVLGTTPTTTVEGYDYAWVGAGAVRFNLNIVSADGNAGFNSRLQMIMPDASQGAGSFVGSNAIYNQLNAWGKFFNGMVTVRGGVLDDYTIATPIWNNFGTTDGKVGLYFDITPVEGLDIGYFQPIPNVPDALAAILDAGAGRAILGVAYNAKDIGKFELGAVAAQSYIQGTDLYVGGAITAVKGLTAQFEVKADFLNANGIMSVLALENVAYALGALTVGTYVGESYDGTTFYVGFEPTVAFKVTDNFSVNAIVNLYTNPSQTWMSPIDAGIGFAGGNAGTFNFGGGVSVGYAASGVTVTFGDYYAAALTGSNMFYVNVDLAL